MTNHHANRKILRTMPFILWAALGLSACGPQQNAHQVQAKPRIVRAVVRTVLPEDVVDLYSATGTVRALLNATLSSKVMGRVTAVDVPEGASIRKGQPLIELDSRELEAALDVASAGYRSSVASVDSALTTVQMEERTTRAKISQAEAQVGQSQAALAVAKARLDLALAGPRIQEIAQTHLAVVQAESSLRLARIELDRTSVLVQEGAIARRDLDIAKNRFEVAKAQYDVAIQSESMAHEGTRIQDIQSAKDSVSQAREAVQQAQANLVQTRAGALQIDVKKRGVETALAERNQARAAVDAARVSLSYGCVLAPFDGHVAQRLVDPGTMASIGVPLMTIEGGEYRLEAAVAESVLRQIHVGGKETVSIDAIGQSRLVGRVVEIAPQADPSTHSFIVKLALPPDSRIRSGMFGRVDIRVGTTRKIQIPTSATWERDGLHYVYSLDTNSVARLRIVTLGASSGDRVQVLSGLNPGDRIVLGDRDEVSEGLKVEGN